VTCPLPTRLQYRVRLPAFGTGTTMNLRSCGISLSDRSSARALRRATSRSWTEYRNSEELTTARATGRPGSATSRAQGTSCGSGCPPCGVRSRSVAFASLDRSAPRIFNIRATEGGCNGGAGGTVANMRFVRSM